MLTAREEDSARGGCGMVVSGKGLAGPILLQKIHWRGDELRDLPRGEIAVAGSVPAGVYMAMELARVRAER